MRALCFQCDSRHTEDLGEDMGLLSQQLWWGIHGWTAGCQRLQDHRWTHACFTISGEHMHALRSQVNTCMLYDHRWTHACFTITGEHMHALRSQVNTCMLYDHRWTHACFTITGEHMHAFLASQFSVSYSHYTTLLEVTHTAVLYDCEVSFNSC